jgi:hypothetical protein
MLSQHLAEEEAYLVAITTGTGQGDEEQS